MYITFPPERPWKIKPSRPEAPKRKVM